MSTKLLPHEDDVSTSCLSMLYQIYLACGFLCALGGAGAIAFAVFLVAKGDTDGWTLSGIGLAVGVSGLVLMGMGEAANVLIALEKRTRKAPSA